uniref:Uncharacterized protein n=1 Tax=Alexandrium catenella TaxID=2925 RepID=A0A7S1WBW2_ALECA
MVSPMRIAREADATPGSGKAKFLSEYLTWRGVSYAWCFHFPMAASGCSLAQLPRWASETLRQHAADARPALKSREALAEARSGDPGWDGMQRYLRETGELHNNARMGWGCALVKWAASPEDALRMLLDLNNTFALDGHAPPSYGGLLGCLGLFGGPKGDSPISGKVSLRYPKPKYAGMPSKIADLVADSPSLPSTMGGFGQVMGGAAAAPTTTASPLAAAFARAWTDGQLCSTQVLATIDLDSDSELLHSAGQGAMAGESPPKRGKRWQRVALQEAACR